MESFKNIVGKEYSLLWKKIDENKYSYSQEKTRYEGFEENKPDGTLGDPIGDQIIETFTEVITFYCDNTYVNDKELVQDHKSDSKSVRYFRRQQSNVLIK